MDVASHKPHLLVVSRFNNYIYTRKHLEGFYDEFMYLESGGSLYRIKVEDALKVIDIYSQWWLTVSTDQFSRR